MPVVSSSFVPLGPEETPEALAKAMLFPEFSGKEMLKPDWQPDLSEKSMAEIDAMLNSINAKLATAKAPYEDKQQPKTKLEEWLAAAIEQGEIRTAGPLYKRFLNALKDSPDWADYKACKGDGERKEFRLKWANTEIRLISQTKKHSQEFSEVDTTLGELMPFGLLVESFGILYDRELAIKLATKHAIKCMQMGGSWIGVDGMAETTLFLKLRKSHSQVMSEKWGLYETWEKKEIEPAATASSSKEETTARVKTEGDQNAEAVAEINLQNAKAEAKAKAKTEAKTRNDKRKRPNAEDAQDASPAGNSIDSSKALMKQAQDLKTRYSNALTMSDALLDEIAGDPKVIALCSDGYTKK